MKIDINSFFSDDDDPIWIKFRRLVQNDMSALCTSRPQSTAPILCMLFVLIFIIVFMYYFTCISFAIRPLGRKSAIKLID